MFSSTQATQNAVLTKPGLYMTLLLSHEKTPETGNKTWPMYIKLTHKVDCVYIHILWINLMYFTVHYMIKTKYNKKKIMMLKKKIFFFLWTDNTVKKFTLFHIKLKDHKSPGQGWLSCVSPNMWTYGTISGPVFIEEQLEGSVFLTFNV